MNWEGSPSEIGCFSSVFLTTNSSLGPWKPCERQPPAVACATLKSLELLRSEHWRREHLARLIGRFRQGAAEIGLSLMDSPTPIQPILVGGSARALKLSSLLKDRGLLVGAIRPPTVPVGSARLRVTLSAAHSDAQLEHLLDALAECWPQVQTDA